MAQVERADVAIIGGGIVGLATALQLLRRRPQLGLAILEKEPGLGRHQSGSQQRGRPRGPVLRARIAQGRALPGGEARARALRRGARDPVAPSGQARGRCPSRRAATARSAARARPGQRRRWPRGGRGRADPRARTAGGGHPRPVVAADRDRRLPGGRGGARRRGPRPRRDRRDEAPGDGPHRARRGGDPGHGARAARRRAGHRLRRPAGRPGRRA